MKSLVCRFLAVAAVSAVAACSQQGSGQAPTAEQQAATAQHDAAARALDTYRQLLRIQNDEMATSLGKDIIKRFPDSEAAKEVQKTLPEIEKRYTRVSEENRLSGLWLYQLSPMAGGTQSTATIYSSQPSGEDKVRLVLRRHTSWGQSVFLYGNVPGFVCRGNCTIATTVDGKSVQIKAFAPPTGEPALMVRDDKGFIKLLHNAKKISMDVTLVKGEKKQTLVYEVGGFDADKWAPLKKKKK
jgi:predicted small lipoprotein YifL